MHLLNAWHKLSHRIVDTGYWSDPNNSNIFSVQGERTLPAWYSGVMIWSAGLGLIILMNFELKRNRLTAMFWGLLALTFFYLSADEALGLHEKLNAPARQMLGNSTIEAPWVVLGLIFACLIGLTCIPLLYSLTKTIRNTMIFAGVVYLSGAVGVEVVGETVKWVINGGQTTKLYTLCYCIEELLEMLGIVIFLHAIHLQLVSRLQVLPVPDALTNADSTSASP